jgi:hypothetical protein
MSALPPFRLATFDAAPIDASPSGASYATQEPLFAIPDYDSGYHATSGSSSAPPDPARGSFEWDLQRNYKLRWASFDAMRAWMKAESRDKCIELIKKESPLRHPNITTWEETHIYVCARQGSGGRSTYQPKNNWERKIDSKRTGCPCRLTVKTYRPDLRVRTSAGTYSSAKGSAVH